MILVGWEGAFSDSTGLTLLSRELALITLSVNP